MQDAPADVPRLWLVFFGDAGTASPLNWLMRPGFRHVSAAAWFQQAGAWVFYEPGRHGTQIAAMSFDDGAERLERWAANATAVLRVASRRERLRPPPFFYCVGAIKALLGFRSGAVTPYGLYRALTANGAEVVRCVGTTMKPGRQPVHGDNIEARS